MAERLQKFLARSGIGSRRDCEKLIKLNKVLVNGQIAKIGCSVNKNDIVKYDGKTLSFIKTEIKLLQLKEKKTYQ